MKRITAVLTVLMIAVGAMGVAAVPARAEALMPAELVANAADNIKSGINKAGGADNKMGFAGLLERVINILLFVVGAVAVLAIIIGGIRYVVSGGDPKAAAGAKDTILYAVIGLVVAFAAYAIVRFVVTRFTS